MSATCKTCRHHSDEVCKRYPPTVSVVLVPRQAPMGTVIRGGQPQMMMQPTPVAAFPPITDPASITCGEHSARLELTS